MIVAAAAMLLAPRPAPALDWDRLWLNDDQRGAQRMQREDYAAAAETFDDPRWRASALYRAGDYQRAADVWAGLDNTQAHYNRGNALARSGDLAAAIAAYETVLARERGHADARHNLALLREMMQDQSRSESSKSQEQQQSDRDGEQGDDGQSGTRQRESGQPEDPGDQSPDPSRDGSQQADRSGESGQQSARRPDSGPDDMPEAAPRQADGEDGEAQGRQADTAEPPEQQAAMDQWLRRIPDDPGGLLRRKFLYQYNRRERGDEEVNQPW